MRLTASAEQLAKLVVPNTVQGVVTSRMDRLTSEQQLRLKAASVIGRSFSSEVLSGVAPAQRSAPIADELAVLAARDLIQTEGSEGTFRFRHAITRDVAYESMLYTQRRALHRGVGQWLEEHGDGDPEAPIGVLAYHWLQAAGDGVEDAEALDRAVGFLQQAGVAAVRQGAFVEAERFLVGALSCYDRLPETERDATREFGLLQPLGTAAFTTNGYGAASTRAIYERAFELADGRVDGRELFPVLWGLWITTHFSFATERALGLGERLVTIADAEDDDELRL